MGGKDKATKPWKMNLNLNFDSTVRDADVVSRLRKFITDGPVSDEVIRKDPILYWLLNKFENDVVSIVNVPLPPHYSNEFQRLRYNLRSALFDKITSTRMRMGFLYENKTYVRVCVNGDILCVDFRSKDGDMLRNSVEVICGAQIDAFKESDYYHHESALKIPETKFKIGEHVFDSIDALEGLSEIATFNDNDVFSSVQQLASLLHGQEPSQGQIWKTKSAAFHIYKALKHGVRFWKTDKDSGQLHLVHTIVRLMFVLEKLRKK